MCIFPGCELKMWCRGLCAKHYQNARNAVLRGAKTWEALEKEGSCNPATRHFKNEFREKRAEATVKQGPSGNKLGADAGRLVWEADSGTRMYAKVEKHLGTGTCAWCKVLIAPGANSKAGFSVCWLYLHAECLAAIQ